MSRLSRLRSPIEFLEWVTDDGSLESKVFHLGHDVFMDLVRVEGDPLQMAGPIEQVVLEVDAGLPLGAVASLDQPASASNAMPRFYALMVGLFAGFSLLLTAVGLYGVVATATGHRITYEAGGHLRVKIVLDDMLLCIAKLHV